jgi:methionyl-tRNA formyltransferase
MRAPDDILQEVKNMTIHYPDKLRTIRIIFMGTPDFAVASLTTLVEAGCNIVGVVTAPDKPSGRGLKVQESAVKKYATENHLKVLQPPKLKDTAFLEQIRVLQADLQVVVAFRMLPETVWSMPPMGTVNLHGSLLPQYRGAAPIQWALINGEKMTGVTTFQLQHEIDKGNILMQESLKIGERETAGELHDRMKLAGAGLLVKTVAGLADGSLQGTPQQLWNTTGNAAQGELKAAPKIHTDDCRIQWDRPVAEVYNRVRGLSPVPGAFTLFQGKTMKILRAHAEPDHRSESPGSIQTDKKTFLKFATPDGYLAAEEVQLEGRKKMTVEEFLRGYRFE